MLQAVQTMQILFGQIFMTRYWVILEVVASLVVLLLILVGIERLLAPWYYANRTRGQPDQMMLRHGGRDSRNEPLTGMVSVPDIEETIRISEEHDITRGRCGPSTMPKRARSPERRER
jgi:hypothetical protein